jgi:hypothetical protein
MATALVPFPVRRDPFYDSRAWHELRYKALKASQGADGRPRCRCCHNPATDGNPIQVDHIKPRSKYPELELDPSNVQTMCRDCNMGKSNTDQTDWRKPQRSIFLPYREAWARDMAILRGPPCWQRTALIFAGALPVMALVAALGTVFIDNAQLPLEQVIWFGAIVLVTACSCANAARWFPAAPKPLTWGTEEDWNDVDLDWGGDRRR